MGAIFYIYEISEKVQKSLITTIKVDYSDYFKTFDVFSETSSSILDRVLKGRLKVLSGHGFPILIGKSEDLKPSEILSRWDKMSVPDKIWSRKPSLIKYNY